MRLIELTDIDARKRMSELISREAAIEAVGERPLSWTDTPKELQAIIDWDCYIAAIENVPAVDVMPIVHGRWVKMTGMMPPEYHGHYQCSECGWHMKGLRNSWTREEELFYCPNCGAKMDGRKSDE